jgi:hypothetical protein
MIIEHENQRVRVIMNRQEALAMITDLSKAVGLSLRTELECVSGSGVPTVFREFSGHEKQVGPDYPTSTFVFVEK